MLKIEVSSVKGDKNLISITTGQHGLLRIAEQYPTDLPLHYSEKRFNRGKEEMTIYVVESGRITFDNQKEKLEAGESSVVYFKFGERHRISDVPEEARAVVMLLRSPVKGRPMG